MATFTPNKANSYCDFYIWRINLYLVYRTSIRERFLQFVFLKTRYTCVTALLRSASSEATFKKKDARGQSQSSDGDVARSLQRCHGDGAWGRPVVMATCPWREPLGS